MRWMTIVVCVLGLLMSCGLVRGAEHPNILLIMTDDQGWGDVHAHGNEHISTPVLDQLAADGAVFDRFYVSPVCAPTRASLLTGRYFLRTNVHGVTRAAETMRADETTLAEVFKANGYATGCFGKWHNGAHYPHHPNGQGFDTFIGFCGGHWNNYFDTHLEHNGKRIETRGYITDVLTDHALAFIDEQTKADRPWLCYVPYNAPHSPWQVPDKYWDKYWDKYRDKGLDAQAACAYAMVENIDDNIGRVLAKLDALEQAENTIVLFLTDNGPNSNRYNGDMKGRKGAVDEGGVRVPLFVRWPGRIKPGTRITPIAAHIDLLPTLVELAGVKMIETKPLDGRSLVPLLMDGDEAVEWPDRMIFQTWGARAAVRTQRWRAVRERRGKWSLYDMHADPSQQKNVASQHAAVLAKLGHAYAEFHREATTEMVEYIPAEVGHDAAPIVTLPGHEALLQQAPGAGKGKGISYIGASGWANDYITNWTDAQAYPAWPLHVVKAGRYEVTLHYCCPAADVGAKVRIEAGGGAVEGVITEAHDPRFAPSPDRIPRKEVFEKTWKTLTIGVIELAEGETELKVRAVEMPGKQVMELKAVELKKVD